MTDNAPKKGLELIPNEVIGYRLTPEANNWTISLVKKKPNGEQYKTPLSYHKTIFSSISWIYNHVSQIEGRNMQREVANKTGEVGNMDVLPLAFKKGLQAALEAVEALEKDLVDNGIPLTKLSSTLSKVLKTDEHWNHIQSDEPVEEQ